MIGSVRLGKGDPVEVFLQDHGRIGAGNPVSRIDVSPDLDRCQPQAGFFGFGIFPIPSQPQHLHSSLTDEYWQVHLQP